MLAGIIRGLLALSGLANESMVRDPGWHFLDAGRRLERAILLTTLLRSTIVPVRDTATDSLMLESVLIASESIISHRRRYRSQARVETVLDLLLLAEDNPRSLAYQLVQLTNDVADLPRPGANRRSPEARLVLEASTMLAIADTPTLAEPSSGDPTRRLALDDLLTSMQTLLAHTASAIDESHFTHLHQPRLLVAGQPGSLGDTLAGVMP